VTKSRDGSIQALVWDYSPVVPPTGQTDQTFYKKELASEKKGDLQLVLEHVPNGRYRLVSYGVGYERNDAYTAYLRMGGPEQLTKDQVGKLKEASRGVRWRVSRWW